MCTRTGHEGGGAIAWSPDGQLLASAGDDTTVQIWRPADGTLVRTYRNHTNAINGVAWSPDGRFVASGSDDATVQVWRVDTGTPAFIYLIAATCVAWSPEGGISW